MLLSVARVAVCPCAAPAMQPSISNVAISPILSMLISWEFVPLPAFRPAPLVGLETPVLEQSRAQFVDLAVELLDRELRLDVDLEVLVCLQPVLRRLPVLAHHDHWRLQRGNAGKNEVEKNIWVRIGRVRQDEGGVDAGPGQQESEENDDERPRATEPRYQIGDLLAEGHALVGKVVDVLDLKP